MTTPLDLPTWGSRVPFTDPHTGILTPHALRWLLGQLFTRIGAVTAMSNLELETAVIESGVFAPAMLRAQALDQTQRVQSLPDPRRPLIRDVTVPASPRRALDVPVGFPESPLAALAALRAVSLQTFTVAVTGTGFTANPTVNATLVVLQGACVGLFLPEITGTSNAVTFTVTGLLPDWQPTQTSWHGVRVTNNSTDAWGLVRLNAGSTTIDVFASVAATAWTAALTKTLYATWLWWGVT